MKKIYLKPEIELIELETAGFLAASVPGAEGGGGDSGIDTGEPTNPSDPNWGSDY